MEVLTGDRQITNDVIVFSDNLSPFPVTADIISDDQPTKPQTEHHLKQPPPQKLRPIRCNGRSLPEYSYHTPPASGGLDGTLISCYGVTSPELGFLTQLPSQNQKLSGLNGKPDEISGAFPVNGGDFGANNCSVLDTTEVHQIKTELNVEAELR